MANIDVTYKGLTGVEVVLTVANTLTIDGLISAIATSEGLPTDYYKVSLGGSPDKNEVSYGDSSATIASMGFVTGSRAICSPNQDGTKQSRLIQKLEIAQEKRQANGDTTKRYYRLNNTYDLTLLPDTHATTADDNPNTGGLVQGRPWLNIADITFAADIWRTDYEGYHNESPAFFDTAVLKASPNDYDGTDTTINEPGLLNNTSIEYKGYFLASYTGTHTFYLNSDDGSYLWVGLTALSGYTTANALINNGGLHGMGEVSATVSLVAGTYYPFRIQFGNGPAGPGQLIASYSWSGQAKSNIWTGKIFHNSATNGF